MFLIKATFSNQFAKTRGENVPVVDKDYYVELYGAYVL